MLTLHHFSLNPFCRKIRLALSEKKVAFSLRKENVWEGKEKFLALNPIGEVPVLIDDNGSPLSGSSAISEYLDEVYPNPPLFGKSPLEKAETRRLVYWFDQKFDSEVTKNLINEKIIKRIRGQGEPDSLAIRAGHTNIHAHLEYISYLIDRRTWLAGDELSFADIAAAAHISTIDYLGDVPWGKHRSAKDWYARIKSRPSFRPILNDFVPGILPPAQYKNLDF